MSEIGGGERRKILAEGALIALGSAYVYLITYFYEMGFCSFFKIPTAFIRPDIGTILSVAAALILSCGGVIGLSEFIRRACHNAARAETTKEIIIRINVVILLSGVVILLIFKTWQVALVLLVLGIIILNLVALIVFVIFGIIAQKSIDRLIKNTGSKNVLDVREIQSREMAIKTILMISVLFALFLISLMKGFEDASLKEDFAFLAGRKNYAFVRQYGDTLFAIKIDRANRRLEKDFLLLEIPSEKKLEMHWDHIGHIENPDVTHLSKTFCFMKMDCEKKK